MPQVYKTSLVIILALVFLLPIFFIPGLLDLNTAKLMLVAIGAILASLAFLKDLWKTRAFNLPWYPFVIVLVLLPLVYLLSALFTTPSLLSLFGYVFEVGTFGYMLLSSLLLLTIALVFTNPMRVLQALTAVFASLCLIALFVTVKILWSMIAGSSVLVFGNFFTTTDTPVGRWTDLATALGLLAILSILAIGMLPMRGIYRFLAYVAACLSIVLLAIINFSPVLIFTLGISVVVLLYFSLVESRYSQDIYDGENMVAPRFSGFLKKRNLLPLILGVVSLIVLINPGLPSSELKLSEKVANTFQVSNTDVRPSLSATLNVSRGALSQDAILGSGPNTFSQDWLIYKPADVNVTPFWGTAFPFGVGFIPTQVASTGILGTVLWLAFFALLIFVGIRALVQGHESRTVRFALVSTLFGLLYLWASSFLYPPSPAILTLAFVFTGLFVALSSNSGLMPQRLVAFNREDGTKFILNSVIVILLVGIGFLGFVAFNKTLAAIHFKKAVDLAASTGVSLDELEAEVNKAIKFSPADIHYIALSRINFARAQEATANTTRTPEDNLVLFQESLRKNIESARKATEINPAGYANWSALGLVYSSLVAPPLSVEGAYENAKLAYAEAAKRNPLNPELPLLLAQLELSRGDVEAARTYIRQSILLKENYAAAYLLLAQVELQDRNLPAAIQSAEKLAALVPTDTAVHFELGLLKYSNSDFRGAIQAFVNALYVVPNYANAQYYLGLSLARIGELEEARKQFEAVAATNPDNQDVKIILEALRSGKSPF